MLELSPCKHSAARRLPVRRRQARRLGLSLAVVIATIGFTSAAAAGRSGSPLTVAPSRCGGLENSRAAQKIDLPATAPVSAFSQKNAAIFRSTPARAGALPAASPNVDLHCESFNIERLAAAAEVESAGLRVSLAAVTDPAGADVIVPAYSFDGVNWRTTETIIVRGIVSNQTHEGYWRFPLPAGVRPEDLAHLQVRLRYAADEDSFTPAQVFIDGLALELTVRPPPRRGFLRRLFSVREEPVILIDERTLKAVDLLDPDGQPVPVQLTTAAVDGRTKVTIRKGQLVKPGSYILRTKSPRLFRTKVTEQRFSFGVASLNTPKSVYRPGDLVPLTLGAVDDRGTTACDAPLTLRVRKPDGRLILHSTSDRSIAASAECGPKSITNQPDYVSHLIADQVGTYQAELVLGTVQGAQTVTSTFEVTSLPQPTIERLGPTRINPKTRYVERLRITPTAPFRGVVEERVPAPFTVTDPQPAAEVRTDGDTQTIRWTVDWQPGRTYELAYTFDAPDVAPALYALGPARIGEVTEPRTQTIAVDEVVRKEDPDVSYQALPVTDADFAPQKEELVEATASTFSATENAHLKVFKSGFDVPDSQVPEQLNAAKALTVEKVEVLGPGQSPVETVRVSEAFTKDGRELEMFHLVPKRTFKPGLYTVKTTLTDGSHEVTETSTFAWGVLALNTQKSVFRPGETVTYGMAALDAVGNTVCDADLTLTVTPTQGPPEVFSSSTGTIVRSPECGPITVTNVPDYGATAIAGGSGDYPVSLTATINGQSYTITDTLRVQTDIPFDVTRSAPTRVFPPAEYDFAFTVTPSADYQGVFEEFLPVTYRLVSVGQGGVEEARGTDTKAVKWTVDWKAGQAYPLTYRVDPEDISPALFLLGPAKVGSFLEYRQWQVASDALITVSGTVYTNEGTTAYDCSATNLTINVRVNGAGTASATCSAANGTYSVSSVSVAAAADVITTYVDANASVRAVAVTRAADATSNITGLDLYQNRVIVRHEDAGPITNTNLDQFDSGNDADVQFTVTTGALTVSSGQELHAWTGKSYSPGGTITTNTTGGDVHITSTATLTAGGAMSVGGSWTNSGTFTAGTNTVTFTATSTGKTLSGTLNGTSAFYKVNFNGTGGEWEIQDSMIVSAANATDTFLVSAGIATFGNSNGDTLEINGLMAIANTANQTATFQTAALAQGSTVTVDVNNNAAPATCANCLIRVGASSGTGTGTLKIRKNAIVRLNARSTATVSDAGIEALSTGYLEIQGSQDDTGTSNGTTNETTLTDTSKSWTTDQHANKVVRITNTGSLAFGKVYTVTANTATALTRADNSSANATVQSVVTTEAETKVKIICASVNSLITANNEATGRYINDQTGTTGLLLIVASTNDSTTCTGSTDLFVVYPSPGALSILVASDTFDIIDGVRANDTFEILDYAHVTAEAGTACNAAVNSTGEGYLYNVAGSDTLIQYAEICNLGRNATTRVGVETSTVNGNNTGEGILINKSDIHHNYRGIRFASNTNNSSANSEGVTNSLIHDNSNYGLELTSADSIYVANNRSYDNTSYGMLNAAGSDSNTWTGNYSYSNSSFGFSFAATGHTITSNYAFENTTENFSFNGNTMTVSSNWAYGGTTYGFRGSFLLNSTLSSNTAVRNGYGIRLASGANDVVSSNTFVANTNYGIFISETNDNTLVYSNTVVDNGARGINLTNVGGTIIFSNTTSNNDTAITSGYGVYFESSSGVGVDNTTLFNNDIDSEDGGGFILQYSVASTGTRFINEEYGVTSANGRDFRIADTTAAHEITMYNTTFASTEIHTAPSAANAYLMSKKHDGVAGAVRFWNDYNIPSDNVETPQDEDTEQYNYANNLWPDSITPHWYEVGYGAGTEDTDIQLAFNGSMGGDGSVYAYRVVCNAANCVTTSDSWDVYRNGTLLTAKGSTGTQYTDSQADGGSAPNVRFTIGDAGTDYTAGATYTFVAYKNSGNTNTQKTITAMQDADTFTVASGRTIELKGQSAGTNVTQATRGATGGYSFIIGGTIDADAYSFNYLGGASQASGLDVNSGATITNLDNGSFDNFGTNVGTADSFIDIDSGVVGSGTPTSIIDNTTFTNTGSNANCNINATGVDATGYVQVTGSTGTFGGETNDCNDGVADADPGQIKWGGIRIKGTVYSNEGSTAYNCSTDNLTINVSVNGGANTAYTCTAAAGTYTIAASAPSAAADPIVISIDSVEIPDATTATLAASTTAAISGLDLYQNRLVVRHENAGPMTNAKLSTGDNADAGIRYAVSAGALTVESGIELHVWNSKTFTPGGTVTTQGTGDLHVDDGATATLDTATSAIARDITVDTGSTLNMNATTTVDGGDITTGGTGIVATSGTPTVTLRGTGNIGGGSGAITFYALTVGDATTATSTATTSFSVNNTLTVGTASTLSVNSGINVTSGTAGTVTINGTISGAGTLIVQNSNLGTGGTLSSVVRFDATNGDITMPNRTYGGNVDVYNNSSAAARVVTMAAGTHTLSAALSLNAANTQNVTLAGATNNPTVNLTGNLTYTNGGAGTEVITSGTGTWTVTGNADFTGGTYTAAAGNTLALNGTGTLTSAAQTLQHLNLTSGGTVTLAAATHTVAGNLTLGGAGTPTVTGSTMTMTGTSNTIDGGGKTLNNLTINPATAGTITLQNTDLTVSGTLVVETGDTLSINVSRTLTHSGGTLTFNGTISGAGTLVYQSSTAFPTSGTISSILRLDATNNDQTLSARTYGGNVEVYNNSAAAARTVTLGTAGSQTLTFSADLTLNAVNTQNVTLQGATWDPTLNVTGAVDFTGTGAGTEIIIAPDAAATWTVSGNVDFTGGTWTTSAETLVMNGTSRTLTSASNTLNHLTLSGSITLANETHTVAGTLNLAGGTITAGTSTVVLTGNSASLTGGGQTLNSLTIGDATNGTVTLQTSDLSVAGTLTVDTGDTLSLDTSRTLTHSGATLTLTGTVSGAGLYVYQSATTFPTTGTLTVDLRMDATSGNQTLGARTYGGDVEVYSNSSAAARTVTLGTGASQTLTLSANLTLNAANTQNLTLQGATWDPALNVTGLIDFTGTGAGSEGITAPDAAATWTVTGAVDLTDGTWTAGAETLLMNGTVNLIGNGQTIANLTVNGANTTVTVATSDVTVSGTLTIGAAADGDNDTFSIGSGRTVTSGTGGTVTLVGSGTDSISGAGTLIVQSSNLGTGGTLSPVVRFDATSADLTMPARTYGGLVEVYSNSSAAARTVTPAAGTHTLSGALNTVAANTQNITLAGATNNPTMNITGAVDFTGAGAGSEVLTTGTGAWSVGGNFDVTGGTFTATAGNTVTLNGSATQTVSGSPTFANLTLTNSSGSVSGCSTSFTPGIDFATSATISSTYTITTAGVKVEYNSGSTYTITNINWVGASGNLIYFRNSTLGAGTWLLNVSGTQTEVSYVDVARSDASSGSTIAAYVGTNTNCGTNTNWDFAPSITFTVSDNAISFGSLSSSTGRWATGDELGANASATTPTAAHTLTVATNGKSGYLVTYNGATLTSGANTISAATVTDDSDGSPGTEQFGLCLSTSGNATIPASYLRDAAASWSFAPSTTTTIASETGPTATETLSVSYLGNIAGITEAGSYATTLTYIMTATF